MKTMLAVLMIAIALVATYPNPAIAADSTGAKLKTPHTFVGGAVAVTAYGPWKDKLTTYAWAGAEIWQPIPSMRFIVAYHHLDIPGANLVGDGFKIIMAVDVAGRKDLQFLLGGGWLDDMAWKLTTIKEPKQMRRQVLPEPSFPLFDRYTAPELPTSASTDEFIISREVAAEFDVGLAWNVSPQVYVGLFAQFVDHADYALIYGGDRNTSAFISLFAGVRDLEDLLPFM